MSAAHRLIARWHAWRARRRWVLIAAYTAHYTSRNREFPMLEPSRHSLTWLLWERPSGKRRAVLAETDYRSTMAERKFCAPVRIWESGGPMPAGADVRFKRSSHLRVV